MASLKILGRSSAKDLQRTEGESSDDDDGQWDDMASTRRPGLGDLLKGAGLALAAGALIVIAVAGAVITLLVVSLRPTHRHGPGDGRHSRRLPVSIAPTSDLQDGESVQVRASRLAGAGEAVIAQCGAGADTRNRGVVLCDLAHRSRVPVRRGKVETTFSLSRSIALRDGRRLNCGTEPGRCVLMVASAENYDRSGFAALSFIHGPT
jgi:hypothetical protein